MCTLVRCITPGVGVLLRVGVGVGVGWGCWGEERSLGSGVQGSEPVRVQVFGFIIELTFILEVREGFVLVVVVRSRSSWVLLVGGVWPLLLLPHQFGPWLLGWWCGCAWVAIGSARSGLPSVWLVTVG